ncbi:helix-hairpin-helix domain-containing protein [Streptomyces sp. NPDC002566]|uniref:helix-hairpin-helix domain-containing protein n=1 Tax=Streptomyces sp. NPDC002566 TaxID=3364650 RepID=UPI0036AED791
MALRSRSHATNPTSGPGRRPGSDGRLRHRRTPARGRVDGRPAPAEELRRRAELLFGGPGGQPVERGGRGESGSGPPGHGGVPGGGRAARGALGEPAQQSGGVLVAVDEPEEVVVDGFAGRLRPPRPEAEETRADATATAAVEGADWRTRAGLALRERMPVWVQARCGLEARSVIALSVVVVAVAAFAVHHFWSGGARTVRAPEVVRAASYEEGERSGPGGGREAAGASGAAGVVGARGKAGVGVGAGTAEIVVDVSGKVREPGIHRLPVGSRVVDALNAAGGVRPGTNTDGLNRARFLVDGEQVVVGGAVVSGGGAVGGGAASGPAAGGAAGPIAGTGAGVPVSLNTATVEQLDALPGVGPVLARHIVDYRAQQGGFRSVDELREVNGIGQRRFADLRDLVRP